jgi:uncharacterized membrane protein HdeD (DUF308 family)
METEKTEQKSLTYWWLPLLFGVIFIILGIWILMAPQERMKDMMKVIGIIAIMSGTAQVIFTFLKHRGIPGWGFQLIGGTVDLAVGVILVTNPTFLLRVVSILVALWLFINGITHLLGAGREKETGDRRWSWEMVLGVILILLALVFVWHPLVLGITLTIWIALAFIVLGLFRVLLTFRLRRHRINR